MNPELEAARIAMVDANARADKFAAEREDDFRRVEEARKKVEETLERYSVGEAGIHRADITQAQQVVRERELSLKLSTALAKGSRHKADEAERQYFIERAADFRIRHADANERVMAAALRLDRSLARTNDAADDLRRAERDRVAIAVEEAEHNRQVQARAESSAGQRANESLAALHRGEWPFVRYAHNHPGIHEMSTLTAELVRHEGPFSGKQNTILTKTAEEFVAAHGIVPPAPPPPPPAPEAQAQPADNEQLEPLAVAAE